MNEFTKFQKYLNEDTKLNRYVATIDCYIWAESDEDAKSQSIKLTKQLDKQYDNDAAVVSLFEQPVGTLSNRKIT